MVTDLYIVLRDKGGMTRVKNHFRSSNSIASDDQPSTSYTIVFRHDVEDVSPDLLVLALMSTHVSNVGEAHIA